METNKRIEGLRAKAGFSKRELARRAGLSATHIGQMESGQKNPTVDVLSRVCEALGISLAEFFAGDSDMAALPEDIRHLISQKENYQIMRQFAGMKARGVSAEAVSEWLTSLGRILDIYRKEYDHEAARGTVTWSDGSSRTDEEKAEAVEKFKKLMETPGFKVPWEE
jgi:HTH-type transcriptional repressor of puuD